MMTIVDVIPACTGSIKGSSCFFLPPAVSQWFWYNIFWSPEILCGIGIKKKEEVMFDAFVVFTLMIIWCKYECETTGSILTGSVKLKSRLSMPK